LFFKCKAESGEAEAEVKIKTKDKNLKRGAESGEHRMERNER
jgi:hypothetical protein